MIVLKTAQKRPFLDTKLAIERARRLKMARNVFAVMRVWPPVVMSYWDAGSVPRCIAYWTNQRWPRVFRTIVQKTAQKRPFSDTKSRQLETAPNLFVVIRLCSSVVLSCLDANFEPRCRRKDFWTACCCCLLLLLLKCVAHPWTLKGGYRAGFTLSRFYTTF